MTQTLDAPASRPPRPAAGGRLARRLRGGAHRRRRRPRGRHVRRDSFWRDLVAFTWNITTVEDPDGRRRPAPRHPRAHRARRGFRTAEPPAEADGVTEAWVEFETAVGRGRAPAARPTARAWTLLTTLYELKGHEEPKGDRPAQGAEHGANKDRETWSERREREARELGYETQP